jgi:acylphosphatase
MKHFNITVTGKVQGVFYRQSTLEIANQLGVKGFVRNEPNGDVYIEAEGTDEQLNKLTAWCCKGPARAHVSDLKISEGTVKDFKSFDVRR